MARNDLHGAEGISNICSYLGPGWQCQGTESGDGFFIELVRRNATLVGAKVCPSFLISNEQGMSFAGRAILYAAGLLYCFLGLILITTIYMKALDCILKHTRKVLSYDPLTGARLFREERVWNPAVADATVLAFGTCVPQISLAVIDTAQNLGHTTDNDLGVGTLLGSTAFNLFVILAVSVVSPKNYRPKAIRDIGVYIVELVWSFWAYIWVFIILQLWTPNVVTLWEAVLTVLQFPVLVLHVYIQDRRWKYVSIPWKASQSSASCNGVLAAASVDTERWCELTNFQNDKDSGGDAEPSSRPMRHENEGNQGADSVSDGFLSPSSANRPSYSLRDVATLWKHQFHEAMSLSTGHKPSPTVLQMLLHLVASYWKISFACIPPVELFHGWLAFLCSIGFITAISYALVKLANVFDCVTGLSPFVLAITILAAGTSFPNLIASKIAAENYETADSAIANINCSNSINVYAGFGLPWCISTIYSMTRHKAFTLSSSGLGFVLGLYFTTAMLCVAGLSARRKFLGTELGGPPKYAWLSAAFFTVLWAVFTLFACLRDFFA